MPSPSRVVLFALSLLLALTVAACRSVTHDDGPTWAIAIHGGAGTLDRAAPSSAQAEYRASLSKALELGRERLRRGDSALDVVEAVVRVFEDDPLFIAGKGAVFNEQGGEIVNDKSGRHTALHKRRGIYVLRMWIPESPDQGFAGPGN